ncbi:hypothetical protein F4860DRAFT_406042 [Xylaria cubensis]|nr:hypothetical protein F4860DRAFT_406042 [Xylaria cubensis]
MSQRPLLALPNHGGIGMMTIADDQGSFQASIFQSQSSVGSIPRYDEGYVMPIFTPHGSCAPLLPMPNESSDEHLSYGSINLDEARIGLDKRPRIRSDKVEKVFACFYDHCNFTASSRKDVRRHMHSDKHQKDHAPELPPSKRFYCKVPDCKDKGFSRRDNLLRHMSRVHKVELEREKPGRKRIEDGK